MLCIFCILFSSCGGSSSKEIGTDTAEQSIHSYPTDITAAPDGSRLYVSNNVSNTISVIDPATLAHIADIPVSCAPRHLAVDGTNTTLYVGHDGTTACYISPIPLLASDETGFQGTKISMINLSTMQLEKEIHMSGSNAPKYKTKSYSHNSIRHMLYDNATNLLFSAAHESTSLAYFDASKAHAVSSQTVILNSGEAGELTGFIDYDYPYDVESASCPNGRKLKYDFTYLVDFAVTSDMQWAFNPSYFPGATINIDEDKYDNNIIDEGDCIFSEILPAKDVLVVGDLANVKQTAIWPIAGCTTPHNALIYSDVSGTNNDKYLFLTCNGNGLIKIINISDPTAASAAQLGTLTVGTKPTVMQLTPDGQTLLVLNAGDGTLQMIPWGDLRSGSGTHYSYLYRFNPTGQRLDTYLSDFTIIGNTAYIVDQLGSKIYKANFKNSAEASSIVSFDGAQFKDFPYK